MADLRRCIGSTRFGIDAHEAPLSDFPVQPSQKDGLGRMCKTHWNAYTTALRKAAAAAQAEVGATDSAPAPEPIATKPSRAKGKAPQADVDGTEIATT